MTEKRIPTLPLGTSSFKGLREYGQVYVDKTDQIEKMASLRVKLFLARPRRFGKSLLTSTFESLFRDGLKYFKGLKIERLWQDRTYPVVSLDFSSFKEKVKDIESFRYEFNRHLADKFGAVGFVPPADLNSVRSSFSKWLGSLESNSLVVLVDEYDSPLTSCIGNEALFEDIRAEISDFFLKIKSNDDCIRFLFITGITKFSSTSIFSGFNTARDISLDTDVGALLGYTEEEILQNFSPWLDEAQRVLGLTRTELMDKLRENYDGFCFDRQAKTHVYNPWSVLNFLLKPQEGFQNYWFSSGGQPLVLQKYLAKHSLENPSVYSDQKEIELSVLENPQPYKKITAKALLVQTGYLTFKGVTDDGFAELGYPNREVNASMAQLYADELLQGNPVRPAGRPSIGRVLDSGTLEEVVESFNFAVNAIDYKDYPIADEASCRAYLQVLLIGASKLPYTEVHTALGRSDLEVEAGDRYWVFEFKYAAEGADARKLLSQGVEQVKSRRYGETAHGKELIRVVMVFDASVRKFVLWESV